MTVARATKFGLASERLPLGKRQIVGRHGNLLYVRNRRTDQVTANSHRALESQRCEDSGQSLLLQNTSFLTVQANHKPIAGVLSYGGQVSKQSRPISGRAGRGSTQTWTFL